MKKHKKSGFSLLEVIAAVVILAVVAAATIATVAPLRAKSDQKMAEQEIATLNSMSQTYFLETGVYPTDAEQLASAGYMANTTTEEKARLTRIKNEYNYSASTGVFTQK